MAALFTRLDGFTSAYGNSYAFSAQSFIVDDVIYVAVKDNGTNSTSVTSNNLTFTQVFSDSTNNFQVYRAIVGSALTGEVVTVSFGSSTGKMAVTMVAGTGLNLANLDNNTANGITSSGNQPPSVISAGTLASMVNAESRTLVFASAKYLYGGLIGADTGYTAVAQESQDDSAVSVLFSSAADTSPTYVIPSSYIETFFYSIEIPEATAASQSQLLIGVSGSIAVTGLVSSLLNTENALINGLAGSVSVTGNAGLLTTTNNQLINGVSGAITVSGNAGVLTQTSNQLFTGLAGSINVTGQVGAITSTVSRLFNGVSGSIAVNGQVATLLTAGNFLAIGVPGSITVTGLVGILNANALLNGIAASAVVNGGVGVLSVTQNGSFFAVGVSGSALVTGQSGVLSNTRNYNFTGLSQNITVNGVIGIVSTSVNSSFIAVGITGSITVSGFLGVINAHALFVGVAGSIAVNGGVGSLLINQIVSHYITLTGATRGSLILNAKRVSISLDATRAPLEL